MFGVFDGLHEGHKYLIEQCKKNARELECKSVIVTFDIDPDEILKNDFHKLMDNDARKEALNNCGCDYVKSIDFCSVKDMAPEEFLDKFFGFNTPASLHVGEGFRFGKNKQGDTEVLLKWGQDHGMKVYVHKLLKDNGEVISSSRIRRELKLG